MRFSTPHLKAIAWVFVAIVSFTVVAIAVRELSDHMHAVEILFIRSAVGVLVLLPVFAVRGWRELRTPSPAGHLLRNGIHFAGQVFWIWGIALLPLATVSAIEFTTPIWAAFLAVLALGERMNRGRWVALGLGFLGILVILQPGAGVVSAGALIMLACAFCFGATAAVTKWLTVRESALAILFYMVLMQTVLGGVASIFLWSPVGAADVLPLLAVALAGLSAHYGLTRALALADATFVMPLEFLRLPFMAVAGFLLYAEPFDPAVILGAVLIFSGNYYSLRREGREATPATAGQNR